MALGGQGLADVGAHAGLEDFRQLLVDLKDPDKVQEALDQIEAAKVKAAKEIAGMRTTMLTTAEEKQSEAIAARNTASEELQTAREEAAGIVSAAKTEAAEIVAGAKENAEALTKGARDAQIRGTNRLRAAEEIESANRTATNQHATQVEQDHDEITSLSADLEARENKLAKQQAKISDFVAGLKASVTEMLEG